MFGMRKHSRITLFWVCTFYLLLASGNLSYGQESGNEDDLIFKLHSDEPVTTGFGIMQFFEIEEPMMINRIRTFHWNNGLGAAPGSIMIIDMNYDEYGSWEATGLPDATGRGNIYWEVKPNVILNPGSYSVLVSDLDSWSTNEAVDYCGMYSVYGVSPANQVVQTQTAELSRKEKRRLRKEERAKKPKRNFWETLDSTLDEVTKVADEILVILDGEDEENPPAPESPFVFSSTTHPLGLEDEFELPV